MSPELEDTLIRRYPELFRGRGKPMSQTLIGFGCDHRDGWYPLLDGLCETVTNRAKALGLVVPELVQIKEKFGGLRCYASQIENESIFEAITVAELVSYKICEISGAPGRLCKHGLWFSTLAPAIAGREGYESVGEDAPPLPPLATEEVARYLSAKWPTTIRCLPRIPGGWLDLVSTLVEWVSERTHTDPDHRVAFDALYEHEGELVVRLHQQVDADQGSIAFARAMARRTDPVSGQTAVR
jgi:hypothetical protein